MLTDKQIAYVTALANRAGFEDVNASIPVIAEAGRKLHPSSSSAFLTRAWDAGRRTLDSLQRYECSKLIAALSGALKYGNPDLRGGVTNELRR